MHSDKAVQCFDSRPKRVSQFRRLIQKTVWTDVHIATHSDRPWHVNKEEIKREEQNQSKEEIRNIWLYSLI
jgi:hypothetical protein